MAKLSGIFVRKPMLALDASYKPTTQGPAFVADLNGDGKMDLMMTGFPVAPGSTTPPVQGRVLFGDGKGGYTLAATDAFPYPSITDAAREVVFADFNGDGVQDTYLANHGWDFDPFPGGRNNLFLSAGSGKVIDATARLPAGLAFSHSVASGDIDRDQDIDLFVGVIGGAGPYFLINDGKGQFASSSALLAPLAGLEFDLKSMTSCLLADLDGDGHLDLVAGAPGMIAVKNSIVLWNQGGSFSPSAVGYLPEPAKLASNHVDSDIQAADVNRDGLLDLIILSAQAQPYYEGWNLQILVNQGNRQFVDETAARIAPGGIMGGTPGVDNDIYHLSFIKLLDFNHDGFVDLATDGCAGPSSFGLNDPLVWLNDGTGRFSTLLVKDFVDANDLALVASEARWTQYEHGWGLVRPFARAGFEQGLVIEQLVPLVAPSTGPKLDNPALRGAPGFNEQYYLATHPAVAADVIAGKEISGLDSWLRTRDVALSQTFAPGATIVGSAQADRMAGREGNETFNGDAGLDTVAYAGAKANYQLTRSGGTWTVKSAAEGSDTLTGVERLTFADGVLALDIDGAAGQAYRIYQAAFNRSPDLTGLGFWIGQMDQGASLGAVAAGFVASPEFALAYGAAPTNLRLVEQFYQNVLRRAGEQGGIQFWVDVLDRKLATVAEVLAGFSESPENQAAVLAVIGQGINYTPY